jgi:starch-binding outer membrane protein, SusD/RagB family
MIINRLYNKAFLNLFNMYSLYKKRTNAILAGVFFFALLPTGCRKFVQVGPPATGIGNATVYASDLGAAAAETDIYDQMIGSPGMSSGNNSISCYGGMTADELKDYNSSALFSGVYTNTLSPANAYFWPELFGEIYDANSVLEGVAGSSTITSAEKQQLTGEAEFMRAFLHFYGTNLFGNFPVVTTTNYQQNNTIARSSPTAVYQQVIADLTAAQRLLPDNFVEPTGGIVTTERVRPNKWAATALLARVYLYEASWDSAEMEATAVINNSTLFSLDSGLNNVFLANSSEAIWQLQSIYPGYNTWDAYYFVLTSTPGSSSLPVALDTGLVNTFEPGDQRLANWVGEFPSGGITYYYPYKYKLNAYVGATTAPSEYTMVLRLAEQYLIRAEARAQEGNLQNAAADLNIIRNRAGLGNTGATTQTDLLNAIYHERRVELFTEWGHRWFDLKRTGTLDALMGSPGNVCQRKGGNWNPDWALFPIPASEITLNPKLGQNSGY